MSYLSQFIKKTKTPGLTKEKLLCCYKLDEYMPAVKKQHAYPLSLQTQMNVAAKSAVNLSAARNVSESSYPGQIKQIL